MNGEPCNQEMCFLLEKQRREIKNLKSKINYYEDLYLSSQASLNRIEQEIEPVYRLYQTVVKGNSDRAQKLKYIVDTITKKYSKMVDKVKGVK